MPGYDLDVILTAKGRLEALSDANELLKDFRTKAIEAAGGAKVLEGAIEAKTRALAADAIVQSVMNEALRDGTGNASGFALSLAGVNVGLVILGPLLAAVLLVLVPFVLATGAAVLVVSAFLFGAAGLALVLFAAAGGFIALGAAVVGLGVAFMGGISAPTGPLATFIASLDGMVTALETAAGPVASTILLWANGLVPAATAVGQTMIAWFSRQVPAALASLTRTIQDLTPAFAEFFNFLGQKFNLLGNMTTTAGGHVVTMRQVVEGAIRGLLRAFEDLTAQLFALGQWFLDRLPTYGPVVQQIFGFMGDVLLGLILVLGRFSDWVVKNWPGIMSLLQTASKSVSDEWAKWAPQFMPLVKDLLPGLAYGLRTVAEHAGALVPFLLALFVGFVTVITVIVILIGWILAAIDWFTNLQAGIKGFTENVIGFMADLVDRVNWGWDTMQDKIDDVFNWIADRLNPFLPFGIYVAGAEQLVITFGSQIQTAIQLAFAAIAAMVNPFANFMSFVNSAIGAIQSLIGWIRSIPSPSLSLPSIPGFQEGGTVPGPIGAARLIIAHGGETITPVGRTASGHSATSFSPTYNISLQGTPEELLRQMRELLQHHDQELASILGAA